MRRVEVSVVEARSAEHQKPRGACTPQGSPTSLIYPYIGKLTSFVIKQFFAFGREHQTLMRSRLRRFCSERCIAADADQKANCFYAAVCTLLSPQNFDSPFGLPQDDGWGGYSQPVTSSQSNGRESNVPRHAFFHKDLIASPISGEQFRFATG